MMFLIDASKKHQHVRQVHLKYEEVSDSTDMPSLRKFIRPTDWESVRSKVKRYAEEASAHRETTEPKYLRPGLCFRVLDDPRKYMFARVAKLSARADSGQGHVWLLGTLLQFKVGGLGFRVWGLGFRV